MPGGPGISSAVMSRESGDPRRPGRVGGGGGLRYFLAIIGKSGINRRISNEKLSTSVEINSR
jgi:hypothetical protein